MSYRRRKDEDVCCYNCKECGHYARDCLLPKRTRKEQRPWRFEDEVERIFWEVMKERNVKPREDPLLRNVCSLQQRVNNLKVDQKKTSYARFKVKQRNIFGLALIDTGNLVHTSIVSGEFWEAIGGRINRAMDYKVGTADGQSEGLQVLGLGEPWPIYLEGIEECYLLEPLVIRGLSHSVNLGIAFLQENNLKLVCTGEEVALMPVKDGSASRARLVGRGCISFKNWRSGKIWRATREQEISTQTWKIPHEKITINLLKDEVEEYMLKSSVQSQLE